MAPAPAPATVSEYGGGGGGARDQSSMAVLKTKAVCTNGGPLVVAPDIARDQGCDTSECSSSFGGTTSGFEGEVDESEPEVNSVISARGNGGGSSKLPRRKKVTDEWRNYVRPILWRCQWLELQMKELSSQVSVYDRELALIKKEKELEQLVCKANGSMSESIEIYEGYGNSIMKRRKRKSHEKNVDASLYIDKHQILSYYHDKQNMGAETGLLIDDDCGNTVDGSRGGLDAVTLLNSENYNTIFEQLTLKYTLMTIDGLQSRVHLLQDLLSKAYSGGENLTLSEDNTHVRVPWKRQRTQKCSLSYTECRYTKPQKRKFLNISLMDDDGSVLAGRPPLPGRETGAHIKDANRNAEERSGERDHLREKTVRMDQLLGTKNSIPNGYIGDLCKENTADILIDNQVAREVCQQFDKAKHPPSGSSSKGPAKMKNISALVEVKNTCAPVETDSIPTPGVEPISPQNKQELKPKKRKKGSFFTKKKKRKEASKTPEVKEKTEGAHSAAKNKIGRTPSSVAVENTESMPSGATGPGTMTTRSAGKKHKAENEPADAKKRESTALKKQETGKPPSAAKNKIGSTPTSVAVENSESMPSGATGPGTMTARSTGKKRKAENAPADFKKHESAASKKQETGKPPSAAKNQETENPSSAAKKQKTESPPSATKKHETENTPSATKETERAPLNLKVEKAVPVAVNFRRSQRARKPKVVAD
ncbi:unnamed protein product [Urochloa decumbens]|uniref:Uncharacterized protein n=1 Tax=Urochloa decumbens TaxID=240449 RepID=A0ABC9AFB8_9POAL